jgi:hypothetical protein
LEDVFADWTQVLVDTSQAVKRRNVRLTDHLFLYPLTNKLQMRRFMFLWNNLVEILGFNHQD